MFTETQEKNIWLWEEKPCHLNVVISSTVIVKAPWFLSQKKKTPNHLRRVFHGIISSSRCSNTNTSIRSAPTFQTQKSPHCRGPQRQGNVCPTIKALGWKGGLGNGVKEGRGSHWITGGKKCTQLSKWSTDEVKGTGVIYRRSQVLTALEFVGFLSIGGWWDTDVDYVVARRLIVCRSICNLLLRNNAVDFWNENRLVRAQKDPASNRAHAHVRATRPRRC